MQVIIRFTDEEWDELGRAGRENTDRAKGASELKVDGALSRLEANTLGLRAEAAVQRATGAAKWMKRWTAYDWGVDMVLPDGRTVQVKCHKRRYPPDRGCFFTRDGRLMADVGVQCQPAGPTAIEVVGWCSREEFESSAQTESLGASRQRVVRHRDLHPAELLVMPEWVGRLVK